MERERETELNNRHGKIRDTFAENKRSIASASKYHEQIVGNEVSIHFSLKQHNGKQFSAHAMRPHEFSLRKQPRDRRTADCSSGLREYIRARPVTFIRLNVPPLATEWKKEKSHVRTAS